MRSLTMNIRVITKTLCVALAALTLSFGVSAQDKASNLNELLRQIKNDSFQQSKESKAREAAFARDKAQQGKLLRDAEAKLVKTERAGDALTAEMKKLDEEIKVALAKQNEAKGDLAELFGHLKSAAADLKADVDESIITAQYPERPKTLRNLVEKLNDSTKVPTEDEIENLWYELNREMVAQGEVVKFNADVIGGAREIVRIGNFNLVADGKYLKYNPDDNTISVLPKQPSGSLLSALEELQGAQAGFTKVGVDPSAPQGGQLLEALVTNTPTLMERIHQGRLVGYIILGVGALGLLIFIFRFLALTATSAKVRSQMKSKGAKTNNPLGRVLKVAENNRGADTETLELKIEEAVLKERPSIESGLNFLKIIAMIAPLLGLLGTVTGMIITFQAMTVYGAGDPTAMASGISSALVTTVLGLVVAIPTVLMHTYLASKARRLIQILDERSAGMIAERSGA